MLTSSIGRCCGKVSREKQCRQYKKKRLRRMCSYKQCSNRLFSKPSPPVLKCRGWMVVRHEKGSRLNALRLSPMLPVLSKLPADSETLPLNANASKSFKILPKRKIEISASSRVSIVFGFESNYPIFCRRGFLGPWKVLQTYYKQSKAFKVALAIVVSCKNTGKMA